MSSSSAGGAARLRLLAEAGLLAVVAAGVLLDSRFTRDRWPRGRRVRPSSPGCLAVLLMGLRGLLAVRARRQAANRPRTFGNVSAGPGAGRGSRLGLGAAWIAVFLLAWPRLGTVVSVPLLVAGLMWLTGERSRLALVSVPLVFAAFIYLVFMVALGVPLPSGF